MDICEYRTGGKCVGRDGAGDGDDDGYDAGDEEEAGKLPDMRAMYLLRWSQRDVLAVSVLLCHQLQHSQ